MRTKALRFSLVLWAAVVLSGPAPAQTQAQLRAICNDAALQQSILAKMKGSRRDELVFELDERCAQIDLSPVPVHDAYDRSPEAAHSDWGWDARYSPDGRMIVSASRDGTVILWDAETGKLVRRIKAAEDFLWRDRTERGQVQHVTFVGDGRLIATSSRSNPVRLFEVATGRLVATLPTELNPKSATSWAAIAATSKGLVLVGGFTGGVDAFDADTRAVRYRLPGDGAQVWALAVSEAAGLVATGVMHDARARRQPEPRVQIWRLDTDERVAEFALGGRSRPGALAFSRDGTQLAVAAGGTVHVYSTIAQRIVSTFTVHPIFSVFDLAFTADGKGIITCRAHPILWDIASGRRTRHFGPFADLCHSVKLSPDGRFAVTTSLASDVRIWEIASGTFHRRLGIGVMSQR